MKATPHYRCGACARPLANRIRKQCAYCGAAIPESQRFTPAQASFLAHAATGKAATSARIVPSGGGGWWAFDCLSVGADIACAAVESILD